VVVLLGFVEGDHERQKTRRSREEKRSFYLVMEVGLVRYMVKKMS